MRPLRPIVALLLCAASAPVVAADLAPRIVNGTVTNAYPSVGALLRREPTGELGMFCSATLIGCRTVLTAAHCFCPPNPITGHTPPCDDIEELSADFAGVFFQHAGLFTHARIVLHPDYEFGARGDAAVITLAEPVTGIAPSAVNHARLPPPGITGVAVGFGRTGGDPRSNVDYGIKRRAGVETALCPEPVGGAPHVCFSQSLPGDAGTCNGDSGGPLFVNFGSGDVVAGITSGGYDYRNCFAPAVNFSTNAFTDRAWIDGQLGADDTTACGDLPAVGTGATQVLGSLGAPDPDSSEQRFRFDIPPSTALARIALNGEHFGVNGDVVFGHGFNMYASAQHQPATGDAPCGGDRADPYKFCAIDNPAPGPLHVLLDRVAGFGTYQLTVTLFSGPPRDTATPTPTPRQTPTPTRTRALGPCIGDCDHDGRIAVSELVRGVNAALRGAAPTACGSLDVNADGAVGVNELVAAVSAALHGCIPP